MSHATKPKHSAKPKVNASDLAQERTLHEIELLSRRLVSMVDSIGKMMRFIYLVIWWSVFLVLLPGALLIAAIAASMIRAATMAG